MTDGHCAHREIGICRNCGHGPTIRAHLMPKALCLDLKGDAKELFVGSSDSFGIKYSQSGLTDTNILCEKCDRYLGDKYDRFGIDFFRNFLGKIHISKRLKFSDGRYLPEHIFEIEPDDTEVLVRFFVSILWRFSISSIPEAKSVRLGPFEKIFQDILYSDGSRSSEPAMAVIFYTSTTMPTDDIFYPPYKCSFYDRSLNGYSFCIKGFRVFVKTDSRAVPSLAKELTINGRNRITGAILHFESSQDAKTLLKIVAIWAEKE